MISYFRHIIYRQPGAGKNHGFFSSTTSPSLLFFFSVLLFFLFISSFFSVDCSLTHSAIMGLSNFLSTLALVSLTFSFDLVAARPFGHKHDQHMTLTKTVRSTYTTTLNDATAEGAHSTFYTTLYTTIHHGGAGASSVISSESETPEVATQTPSGSTATSATSPSATEGSSSNGLYPPQTYTLVKEFCNGGTAFFDEFNFYTGSDPTNGFVE